MFVNKRGKNVCPFGLNILVGGKLLPTNVAVRLDNMLESYKNVMDRVQCAKRREGGAGRGGGGWQLANLNRNDRVDSVDQAILE